MNLHSAVRARLRAYLPLLAPAVFLLAAFSPSAHATPSGLFGAVTPITASVPANSYLGYGYDKSVAYSADGHTALVAAAYAPVAGTSNAGIAYIYHYANRQWALAKTINDPDVTTGSTDYFGDDVALSADGTAALIGSCATVSGQSGAGKAYLYTLTNGTWTQAHEFDDPAPVGQDDYFGCYGVSISAHGKTLAMSAPYKTINSYSSSGEVYVYSDASGSWAQTAAIPDPDGAADDFFGAALSLAADGSSLLAGSAAAVSGQTYAGKAYLYSLSNGTWSLANEFDDPNATSNDEFGYTDVDLSANAQTAVIGAYGATANSGAAYIYSNASGNWSPTAVINDPDATSSDYFGYPVAISGNGQSVLIGSEAPASGTLARAGKAYLFTQSNGTWTQAHEFDDPAATAGDYFGDSGVALSADGESAFISAAYTTVNGKAYAGEAYIFQSPDDLSLALSASPTPVTAGNSVALDATVINNDSAVTANNVVLTVTLPTGLSYVSSNAAGGSCSASTAPLTCTEASLAPGATWQPSITAKAVAPGTFSASGTVASNEPDPATSNNAATATVNAVAPPPQVSITNPPNSATVSGTVVAKVKVTSSVQITKVVWKVDGQQVNSTTTAPYSYNLDTSKYAVGSHTLTAVATDTAGISGSATNNFTIVKAATPPPTGGGGGGGALGLGTLAAFGLLLFAGIKRRS